MRAPALALALLLPTLLPSVCVRPTAAQEHSIPIAIVMVGGGAPRVETEVRSGLLRLTNVRIVDDEDTARYLVRVSASGSAPHLQAMKPVTLAAALVAAPWALPILAQDIRWDQAPNVRVAWSPSVSVISDHPEEALRAFLDTFDRSCVEAARLEAGAASEPNLTRRDAIRGRARLLGC